LAAEAKGRLKVESTASDKKYGNHRTVPYFAAAAERVIEQAVLSSTLSLSSSNNDHFVRP
jgi:hypothetical protein